MIRFSVPVYYTQLLKTKPNKTTLVGMNHYRNDSWHLLYEKKKHYDELVKKLLKSVEWKTNGQYCSKYIYFYKNKSSDMMNVCTVIDKFIQDTIQGLGIVENDNVQFYTRAVCEVGGQDRSNPRVDILIEERVD